MEDRERAIRVVPDLDRGFDEVMSDRALRQLQSQPGEGDRVVAGNDALLLNAQDLSQLLRVGGGFVDRRQDRLHGADAA